jgi:DNA-binding response OmpR family regulator
MHSDTLRASVWFDAEKRLFFHGEKQCRLRRTVFDLCVYLSQQPQIVKTRDQILDALRGEGCDIYDVTVDHWVKLARHQMGADLGFCPIQTLFGVGYYWDDGSPQVLTPRPETEVWCDVDRHLVIYGSKQCRLSPKPFKLCAILAARPDVIKSREFFYQALYKGWRPSGDVAIDYLVKNARIRLWRDLGVCPIMTSHGVGYYWSKSIAAAETRTGNRRYF